MDQARYFFGVLVVTCLPPALLWWLLVHPFVAFWRSRGPRVTLSIMTAVTIGGIVLLMTIRDQLLIKDYGTHPLLWVLAGSFMIGAAGIAIARRRHLTFRVLSGVPELAGESGPGALLTQGIYGRLRHPRYVEVILGTLAYATFSNHLGAYLVAIATIPAVHLIVLLEERELAQRFGSDYEAYRARVPRYVPRRGPPRG